MRRVIHCLRVLAIGAVLTCGSAARARKPSPAPSRVSVELQAERDHKALADRDAELSQEHRQWLGEHRKVAPPKDSLHARIEKKHLARLRAQARTEAEHTKLVAAHSRVVSAAEKTPTGLEAAQAAKLAADHKKMKADHEKMYLELLQMRAQHDTMLKAHEKSSPTP